MRLRHPEPLELANTYCKRRHYNEVATKQYRIYLCRYKKMQCLLGMHRWMQEGRTGESESPVSQARRHCKCWKMQWLQALHYGVSEWCVRARPSVSRGIFWKLYRETSSEGQVSPCLEFKLLFGVHPKKSLNVLVNRSRSVLFRNRTFWGIARQSSAAEIAAKTAQLELFGCFFGLTWK